MADKDNKDMDGAREKAAVSRDHSPIASTRTEVDDDREERASYVQQTAAHEKAHAYETEDDTDHGEPDWEAEEAGETVPGRQLDRQLSAVRDVDSIQRIASQHSLRSKASRVFSRQSRKSQKDSGIKRELLPVTDLDAGIVGWDGQDDENMPLNFTPVRKWVLVGLLSAITLVTPLASSILSPGISRLMVEFEEDSAIVGAMTVSIYLLGYVIGPMFLAPLSEIYGRRPIITATNIFFCCWQIGCALAPSIEALIVFRFFSGVGGSGCLTLGGGIIADIFRPEQRGFAMGMWTVGPLFGPTIGPLIGGFVAETIGWRWDFWIVLIIAVMIAVMIEFFNQETSHRVLIAKKVERLKKELGRDDLRSCYDASGPQQLSQGRVLANGLIRPIKMLLFSPILLLLTIYISFAYGTLYLLFTTIPSVFESTYGFSVGLTGLVYLGLGLGTTIGWLIITFYSDKTVIAFAKRNNGEFEPEMRLWISIWFSWLLPITFFWYGWCAEYKVHYMATIISLIPFGIGIMGLFLPITTYLVDCYPMYAASAIAANTELRSLVGAFLPLAGTPMYDSLGLGWGNSLLGFLCIVMIPVPIIFNRFGKRLRKMEKFKL